MTEKKDIYEYQKAQILTLLAAGLSEKSAIRSAGLEYAQFNKMIAADSKFNQNVIEAQQQAELFFLTKLRDAATEPTGWRAAAWWLERQRNERYGYTRPDQLTKEKVATAFQKIIQIIHETVKTERKRTRILKMIASALEELG